MRLLLFLPLVFLAIAHISADGTNTTNTTDPTEPPLPKCGENEKLWRCGSDCEPSCANPNPGCWKVCYVNVCQCAIEFVRDGKTNKCVKLEDCSK